MQMLQHHFIWKCLNDYLLVKDVMPNVFYRYDYSSLELLASYSKRVE